ncbi:MAG TPA: N-6 DNA methylase, partial [Polyangiaceae bacterium]
TLGKLRFLPNQQRKQRGMFYTPRGVVRSVVESAMRGWSHAREPLPRVCDPSLGGGVFLLGAARALTLAQPSGDNVETRRAVVTQLHGYDIEPMAIAVTEAALMLWCDGREPELERLREQLQPVDALAQRQAGPFELVIGNPPWVAYAGRATQPMPEARRRWLAAEYEAFRGYPTLHACFVELAAKLTPRGRIALLVPSPIADLNGYRPMRRALTRTHRPAAELVEYGQDAFEGVVQPCFGLIADAATDAVMNDGPFSLIERSGLSVGAVRLEVPAAITRLASLPRFSPDCFREYGFQTTGQVTRTMLLRADVPKPPFVYPLLQGRDVTEFTVRAPRLFLNADRKALQRLLCRLRDQEEYQRVEFVIRQTAKFTIAALHNGLPFRNSLLAGFGDTQFTAAVLVGLLNSTLLRCTHLAGQRDARQKTFPQVKLAHLRALPAPLPNAQRARELETLVGQLQGRVLELTQRQRLDALVYAWYGLDADAAAAVDRFYRERAG